MWIKTHIGILVNLDLVNDISMRRDIVQHNDDFTELFVVVAAVSAEPEPLEYELNIFDTPGAAERLMEYIAWLSNAHSVEVPDYFQSPAQPVELPF